MAFDADEKLREAFRLAAQGVRAGLEWIWAECARPLHNYAFALTGSQAEADDVLAEVIAALIAKGPKLARVRQPRAYLFAAVRNEVRYRARRRARRAPDCIADAPNASLPRAEDLAVHEALMALPVAQREVVVLHIWGGLTFEEVAQAIGVSPNTAASRYRYALEKLRRLMADETNER